MTPSPVPRRLFVPISVMTALALSGCQTLAPDAGMQAVADIAGRELRKDIVALRTADDAAAARSEVSRLLKRPLTADSAVQIALLNNRGLQAAYNELGLAEARRLEAGLPPNPTFSVSRLSSVAELEIEKKIVANILALATLPLRTEIAADRFRQAQLDAARETLSVAAEARRSFYRAVSARQSVSLLTRAKESTGAASELARRLGETGALNKLDQAREQVFDAELTVQLARARQAAEGERERLTRILGLWGEETAFRLPGTIQSLPSRPQSLPWIEIDAVRRRLDLQIARLEVEALAKSRGLTEATRFINLLEVAGIDKSTREKASGERERSRGFEIEFQIPIFDFGEARVRQAKETYLQAVNRLMERAVNVRSEAREAYRAYRAAYDIARHYHREILPLRQIISEESLLRYNAMQVDVFALLSEARQRLAMMTAAIEAQRDFWLATVDLGTAVVGGGTARPATAAPSTVAAASPAAGH